MESRETIRAFWSIAFTHKSRAPIQRVHGLGFFFSTFKFPNQEFIQLHRDGVEALAAALFTLLYHLLSHVFLRLDIAHVFYYLIPSSLSFFF